MPSPLDYAVNRRWSDLLRNVGVEPEVVLESAGLPRDLFERESATLSPPDMFRLWLAADMAIGDPLLPLRVARSLTLESFDTAIFAALCSRDLNAAAGRIAAYKRLIGPARLDVEVGSRRTRLEMTWPATVTPPVSMALTELVFWVALVRLATGSEVVPAAVTCPDPPDRVDAYHRYLGVTVRRSDRWAVSFSAVDAGRPFFTANEGMWQSFEDELGRRLVDLERTATTSERVRATLLELLPAGETNAGAVGATLGLSVRSLQRRLQDEGTSFKGLVNETRSDLAVHYLRHSELPIADIAFLLGYGDHRSFYRAFHSWTGSTPKAVRLAA
ncbi:MAG: AraC family transcriptional regulator ligand-binding domain-containing protein [Actinomycetota bacterium]